MRKRSLVATLLLLTSCSVGPNYRPPCIETPSAYMYATASDDASLDTAWWELFDDSVLTTLIEEALCHNHNLVAATANIRTAMGQLMETQAPLFPQLGYQGNYDRTHYGSSPFSDLTALPISIPETTKTWEAVLNGSWQLDLWGRTRHLTEAARANLYGSCAARQAVTLSLLASVANSYITLRGLDQQLIIAQQTRDSYQEEVVYFETQFKYGQASQMAVAQAQTQYETAAAEIPQIETQIAALENSLSLLTGNNPFKIPRGKSIYELQLPPIPAALPSELLCRRPDILQAEQELIAANAKIGATQALYFPAITLTGFYGGTSAELKNLFSGPANTWNYSGTLVGPLFTAGAIYGQVEQARGATCAALAHYEQTIQSAFADVETALVTHAMLKQQLEAQTRLVKAAGQYQHLATLQYQGGYSPYFAVIQAQEQYFPAQLAWAQARAALFISIINIYQALGGGLCMPK